MRSDTQIAKVKVGVFRKEEAGIIKESKVYSKSQWLVGICMIMMFVKVFIFYDDFFEGRTHDEVSECC